MTQILDEPEAKPLWKSITILALTVLAGVKGAQYQDLIGSNTETIVTFVGIVVAIIGRWRAGGVSIPLVGAKK